jgi:hypothetical protein
VFQVSNGQTNEAKRLSVSPFSLVIEVFDEPGLVLLALVLTSAVDRCHGNLSDGKAALPYPDYTFMPGGAADLSGRATPLNPLPDLRRPPPGATPEMNGPGNLPRRKQPPQRPLGDAQHGGNLIGG